MPLEVILTLIISIPLLIIVIAVIVLDLCHANKYPPKVKLDYDQIETPKGEFFEAKVLKKRMHIYYVSEVNISRSATEYYATFLLENGEEREYQLTPEMFEKIEEGQESTLVLLNGRFFDFGEGEPIEEDEQTDEESNT